MSGIDRTSDTITRRELDFARRVFLVSSWGYAADHMFGWFPKALNCHPEVFVLLAHEGSRPKYFGERTRGERPPLESYIDFLNDMGMTYEAIGDCYSYRAPDLSRLASNPAYADVPVINLVRHPLIWLRYYVSWRTGNMRMVHGQSSPLRWEWQVANHALFASLGLRTYEEAQVQIWSFYQGLFFLNSINAEIGLAITTRQVEEVFRSRSAFDEVVHYLTKGVVRFSNADWEKVESMKRAPFRGETGHQDDAFILADSWAPWQVEAFHAIVEPPTIAAFESLGYKVDVQGRRRRVSKRTLRSAKPRMNLFHSSQMKSGTWLARDLIRHCTGLVPFEPDVPHEESGAPRYNSASTIFFPPRHFFSWHQTLGPDSIAALRSARAKSVLQFRNLAELVVSQYNHLVLDPDRHLGRSIGDSSFLQNLSVKDGLTLVISGFTSPGLTWSGLTPHVMQLKSFVDYLEDGGDALLVSYSELLNRPSDFSRRLQAYLELGSPWIFPNRRLLQLKSHMTNSGHRTPNVHRLRVRSQLTDLHLEMIRGITHGAFPNAKERLATHGIHDITP